MNQEPFECFQLRPGYDVIGSVLFDPVPLSFDQNWLALDPGPLSFDPFSLDLDSFFVHFKSS